MPPLRVRPAALVSPPRFFAAVLLGLLLGAPPARSQCLFDLSQELRASDASVDDLLGSDVCIDGDVALLGAAGDQVDVGAAYFFRHDGVRWVEEQKVTASDGGAHRFGEKVAVSGNLALVAAAGRDLGTGAVYAFRYDGVRWVEEQILTGHDSVSGDSFGFSVDMDGGSAVVGAGLGDSPTTADTGACYVFRYDGAQWAEEQKLTAADTAPIDLFAIASISGDVVLIGAPLHGAAGPSAGAAYTFRHDGVRWSQEQKLVTAITGTFFGFSTDVDGDVALIGAPGTGIASVFRFGGALWAEEQVLFARDQFGGAYGWSVDVDGDRALVGSAWDSSRASQSGSAYVVQFDGSGWVDNRKLVARNYVGAELFGSAVSLCGDRAMCGAPRDGIRPAENQGAGYAFELEELALGSNQDTFAAGDTLVLRTCGGQPAAPGLLAVVDANGQPMFLRLDRGPFDGAGERLLVGNVPAGLTGLEAGFLALGFYQPGRIGRSNVKTLTFE